MQYLIAALALSFGFACTILAVFGATFVLGAWAPGWVAKSGKLSYGFLALNLLLWLVAATLGASVAIALSPFSAKLSYAAFTAMILAATLSSAFRHRKQQSLIYQLAVVAIAIAGVALSEMGLQRL